MMKTDRLEGHLTKLEKNQMLVIDKLQDRVRLLEFDKSSNLAEISVLKSKIKLKKETIKKIIDDLEEINKEKNYERIWYVINNLKNASRDDFYE